VRLLLYACLGACSSGGSGRARDAAPPPRADAVLADAAKPPPEGLVDVAAVIPDAVLVIRYATADNFTGAAVYDVARCWLRAEVAERLAHAADTLRAAGHRLVLWDCYRPASAQKLLWERVHDPAYVAEPEFDRDGRPVRGSVHSRAAAVDVGLADLDGKPEPMPTDHDFFGPAAHRDHPAEDPEIRARMRLLDDAMTAAGFEGLPTEWWHYGFRGSGKLPLLDVPLE
jgi:zinc D-Ala-D-Ala dipeptidase